MQIDFHHAATYVIARDAGFSHDEADLIAYSAQYVDDATTEGPVCFSNGAMYQRISSSHPSGAPGNLDNRQNRMTWLPFHFLPGNGGLPAGQDPPGSFIDKLVCRPDSNVAKDMVRACLNDRDRPFALQRLGVTMHVYADTFAHQGFAGVLHAINEVKAPEETSADKRLPGGMLAFWDQIIQHAAPPIGHGRALTLPDLPFLQWRYTDGRGKVVPRDNTSIFIEAAHALCHAMQAYRSADPGAQTTDLPNHDEQVMHDLFVSQTDMDPVIRHKAWLSALQAGQFSFGPAIIAYDDAGPASWKAQALGTTAEAAEYNFDPGFLTTRWKYFHDALQLHRLTVLHDVLPKYGICVG
jgi:hypothetical protein